MKADITRVFPVDVKKHETQRLGVLICGGRQRFLLQEGYATSYSVRTYSPVAVE